jgi:ferredoxin-NADP reductase
MSFLKQFTARLFGRTPATPATPATTEASSSSVDAASPFRSMRIARVVQETKDAVVLWLEPPNGEPVSFQSGQFLTFSVEVAGERLYRSYSICSAPNSGELAVAIKRVTGGRVSNFLNDQARPGLTLDVRGPSGRFVLPAGESGRRIVLIAGGSGITPLLSHTRHLLETEPDSQVALLYGNRSEGDVIFRDELTALAQRHPERFLLRHVLSAPTGELECARGLLDVATTAAELTRLGLGGKVGAAYLVCGPEPMMEAAQLALAQLGVPKERVLEERFSAAPVADDSDASAPQPLTVRMRGKETRLTVTPGETMLEAGLRAGAQLDFSCMTGDCGTCMSRLVEGTARLSEPNCLTEAERKQGLVLPCVARPTSPCTIAAI